MTRLYGVAGNPIFHSKSPLIFNTAFRRFSLDATYVRLAAGTAAEAIVAAREMGLDGLNITAPFKTDIIEHLDRVEEDARRIGSVNTVVKEEDGFAGYNTDTAGVLAAVRSSGMDPAGSRAVVVGAGGAARAAVLALNSAGAHVTLVNRTYATAQEAAKTLECEALPMERLYDALKDARLLVAAVSADGRYINPSFLKKGLVVLDANYGRPTALTNDAARSGCTVIDGREWLLGQAIPAFALFANRPAPQDVMRKVLMKRRVDSRRNIALVGFMGSGKSSVARRLGVLSGMPVIDIDERIEEKAALPVAEIFEKKGEEEFRRMEQTEIDEIRLGSDRVIACGGGVVMAHANIRVLRNNCLTIWLWVGTGAALKRIGDTGTRPLLTTRDPQETAEALLARRIPYYARISDLVISTEGRSPEEVAERIWHEIHHAFED